MLFLANKDNVTVGLVHLVAYICQMLTMIAIFKDHLTFSKLCAKPLSIIEMGVVFINEPFSQDYNNIKSSMLSNISTLIYHLILFCQENKIACTLVTSFI